jgi:hypothetical protein
MPMKNCELLRSCRLDLDVVEGDKGAGELVDPDPVVSTVGAN